MTDPVPEPVAAAPLETLLTATTDQAADPVPDTVTPVEVDPATLVPESYKLTYPEGTHINETLNGEFKAAAKQFGLTQAQAQGLTDLGAKMQATLQAENLAAWDGQRITWEAQTRADKELGGDKFDENLAISLKGYNAFASPELKTLLNSTGIGSHPEMIRAFYKAGLTLKEDGITPGDKDQGSNTQTLGQRMYPGMNP